MNNGFKMWRRLHEDNTGSGSIIELAGTDSLRDWPHCDKLSEVSAHLDAWTETLDLYGGELENAPRMIRSMLLNIIPKDLNSEAMPERSLVGKGHVAIIE